MESSERLVVRLLTSAALVCGIVLSGCDTDEIEPDEIETEEPRIDPIRKVFAVELDHPAVWNESDFKTLVNKIEIAGGGESYNFLVTTYASRETQFIGQTERLSIRKDFAKGMTPQFLVTDIHSFTTTTRDPVYLSVGGKDVDDSYSSRADLDEIALPFTFTQASGIDLSNYKAHFASFDRANILGEDFLNGDRNFYIAGNAYDAAKVAHPFIATLTSRWHIFTDTWTGNISTFAFLDDLGGEVLKIKHDHFNGIYILTLDNTTNEIVISRYSDVDVNNNHRHDPEDSYKKVWSTRIKDFNVDKFLANFTITEGKLFLAGSAIVPDGDEAGKLVSLDKETGALLSQTLFNYSDDNDAFYGVTQSGQNIFGYGYSHQMKSGTDVVSSRGWAVKFSFDEEPLQNYVYTEENAIIEFTAGVGGYEQNNFNKRGSFAIGGSRKTVTGFTAFATEFVHSYN